MNQNNLRRLLPFLLCLLLLLVGCGNNAESTVTHTDKPSVGTTVPYTDMETQRITAPDPDDDLNGPVYTDPPYILEDDDPLAPEIKAALAEKKAKLIWAADCFSETQQEVKIWHYTLIDCNELYEGLLKELFPDATVEKREEFIECLRFEMKSGETEFGCTVEATGYVLNIFHLPTGLSETLLPKAADWLAKKTGVEQREWTDYDPRLTPALKIYTACVDGIQVGALGRNFVLPQILDIHGVQSRLNTLSLCTSISVGEEAGTVKLSEALSQEELRNTLEFRFNPNESTIVVYRSCKLCYLIDEAKGLLVPVWWVKGVTFSTETGEGTSFEIVYDLETGSMYQT